MSFAGEKRLLQAVLLILSLSPLGIGALGALGGPAGLGEAGAAARDAASHFRYLSGVFVGVGVMLLAVIPAIERESRLFGLIAAAVIIGGLARLAGVAADGWPSIGHRVGLVLELGVTPGLWWWQRRLARRTA